MLKRYFRIKSGEAVWNPKTNKWTYSRGHPVGLVVGTIKDDVITLGFSLCSMRDSFNRPKANQIATGRLNSQQFTISAQHLEFLDRTLGDAFSELQDTAQALCESLIRKQQVKPAVAETAPVVDTVQAAS